MQPCWCKAAGLDDGKHIFDHCKYDDNGKLKAGKVCGLLSPRKRPDPRLMAPLRWSLQRGWHGLGAQVVVISSLSVMTGCYHLVRINVVCYDQAPIPILGLDAAAGGGQSGVDRLSPKWPIESKHELIMINMR